MIIVAIRGGIGTQMFCYALGRTLAERSNQTIKFDDQSTWDIYIENFDTNIKYVDGSEINSVVRSKTVFSYLVKNPEILTSLPRGPQIAAKLWNFYFELKPDTLTSSNEIAWPQRRRFYQPILNIDKDAYLLGHWQSPKYFDEIKNIIRNEFTVSQLSRKNKQIADQISTNEAVGLHVRRGAAARRGNALPADYYKKACDLISKEKSNPHIFIFSDDPSWSMDNLSLDYPTTYITHNGPDLPHLDLELLRRCDHQVTSASTFSWWGAWLNRNKEKIVTVPKPWKRHGFSEKRVETWEYMPQGWHRVEYE